MNEEILAGLRSGIVLDESLPNGWELDMRRVLLNPEYSLLFTSLFVECLGQMFPDTLQVAGYGYGSYPLVAACSTVGAYSGVMLRVDGKKRGVSGHVTSGSVVLVDDVITSGESAVLGVEQLEQLGFEVAGFLALGNWGNTGIKMLNAMGIQAGSMFDLQKILYRSTYG